MKTFAPKYYKDFKCIGKKCRHNCCIGWEIDIDNDTFESYKHIKGDFGKKLERNIAFNGGTACFKLSKNGRCPFLNGSNLCEIILKLGENNLCQICTDHPRFRSFYNGRTEMGIGLCCEEACRLIVTQEQPFELVLIDEDNEIALYDETEEMFYESRDKIFKILMSSFSLKERIDCILAEFDIDFSQKAFEEWVEIFLNFEILDKSWADLLIKAKKQNKSNSTLSPQAEKAFENLFIYFIYRHLGESIYDGKFTGRLLFSVLSCYMIHKVCNNSLTFDNIIEISRMYSAEIEYSDENLMALIDLLQT